MKYFPTNLNRFFCLTVVLLSLLIAVIVPVDRRAPTQPVDIGKAPAITTASNKASRARVQETLARLPLSFEANVGQVDRQVHFLARGPRCELFLTSQEAVFVLQKTEARVADDAIRIANLAGSPAAAVLRMKLAGANSQSPSDGLEPLPGKKNYFIGNDPRRWRTNVASYAKVRYREVYRGIDVVYYGNQRQLEYDFVVAPGADPRQIKLEYDGAEQVRIEKEELVIRVGGSEMQQRRPVVYQEMEDGERRQVRAGYRLEGGGSVGFELGEYDASRALIIDPIILGYSTYFGSDNSNERGFGIAVDSAGNAYVTGNTFSINGNATFVIKVNTRALDTASLVYSTFIGGSGAETGHAIAVDPAGNAYITGETSSADFPTPNGFQHEFGGGRTDAFVTKLDPTGSSLPYSTFLGGNQDLLLTGDVGHAIAIDSAGDVYVAGSTTSDNFPKEGVPTSLSGGQDAFVAKLNTTTPGLRPIYSRYLGGRATEEGFGIAVDSTHNAYVTGLTTSDNFPKAGGLGRGFSGSQDVFITKLEATGSSLIYSTFLGGAGVDVGRGIVVDAAGNAYIVGQAEDTTVIQFPTTAGAFNQVHNGGFDVFVAKLNPTGSSLIYSTFLGGNNTDIGFGIAIDSAGNAYVTGETASTNFRAQSAFGTRFNGGAFDAFVTKLDATGSDLIYSTFLGGSGPPPLAGLDAGNAIAVDSVGDAYVTGETSSSDFRTTDKAFDKIFGGGEAFVSKIGLDTDSDGVLDSTDNCPTLANPDQADNDHDALGDVCDPDDDNDGDPDTTDCASFNPAIHHGAVEVCNGIDDNCVAGIDENFPNNDGDALADCVDLDDDNDGDLDATDCSPFDQAIHHGAVEVCNGIDDNCDGRRDEGFPDTDGDGQGNPCDPDDDNDTVPDSADNCPLIVNRNQADFDLNGQGDVCDCVSNSAVDISKQVRVRRGPISFNAALGLFVQEVTIAGPFGGGPISLALDGLSTNIRLRNADGVTNCTCPLGSPFKQGRAVSLTTVSVQLQFRNPTNQPISYNTRVLAGRGVR